jgi:1-acyl-sn-glycerol-3-phosphate acyltransferase
MFATIKLVIVIATLGSIAGIVGMPFSLLSGNIRALYRVSMGIINLGLGAAGIRRDVLGLENVPAGRACIFMSNHVSNLDPPVLFPVLPGQSSVLLKAELMKIPILGRAMRMGHFVPVERSSSREKAQQSVAAAADALRSGLHMLVFPEGTRSRDGRLQPFKKGSFFLAMQTGAPVVPVLITGTEHMMEKGSVAITPGLAVVRFLPPFYPERYAHREALTEAVRAAMIAALPEGMRPAGTAA